LSRRLTNQFKEDAGKGLKEAIEQGVGFHCQAQVAGVFLLSLVASACSLHGLGVCLAFTPSWALDAATAQMFF
jgi:hypothetical protein